ncbi:MAG: GatB/YqeY domain-containing protein [Candidatus Saccharimonadaceae bacterium]|nr:GatB/YqeY domain-containing protein [Candidatus Saccharimonadaceae bacterium]
MALKDKINNDLKAALLGGNRFSGEVLRNLKAAILNEEVAKKKREEGLGDIEIEQVIAREVKKRNESAVIYENAGRIDLAENERNEAKVLSGYLPEQLSEEDINIVVNRTIDEIGAKNMSAMGQVIGAVKNELGNAADGSIVARLVKEALSQ